ncbi:hypothetical protein L7F22_048464 [Adiantum nelumboides]|nr:hypothetical protein [Adiantum nelumboides]
MAQQPAASSLIPATVRAYHLDKLTGPNYLTWATRVTLLLKRASLWEIVDGTKSKTGPNDPDFADWNTKDLQAQAELMLHLGDRQVQMVRRCTSSVEIWAFLCQTYHHEDLIARVTALKKLLGSALTENQDTSKFLDEWRTFLDNALLSGLQLDDSLQSMLLLVALPTSWRARPLSPPKLRCPQKRDVSSTPPSSKAPSVTPLLPQVEWEESKQSIHIPPQVHPAPLLQQQNPSSPNPIPTPQRPPPWTLGCKTNTYLFPKSPNPLYPGRSTPSDFRWHRPPSRQSPQMVQPVGPTNKFHPSSKSGDEQHPNSADLFADDGGNSILNHSTQRVQPMVESRTLEPDQASRPAAKAQRYKSLKEIYEVVHNPSRGSIHISQQFYTQSFPKKFSMKTCKGVDTPLPANVKFKWTNSLVDTASSTPQFPYANILGGIRYLVTCTRPDIYFAANVFSRFMSSPGAIHIQYLKRAISYLQQTKQFGLTYSSVAPQPSPFLVGY